MTGAASMLKELGEPLVREAFDELLSSNIPSAKAKRIIREFRIKWKDYARPALMMMICEAVGGDPKNVAPVAKAMILTAGAFDIHDDIIDKTYEKSEKKTKTLLGIYGQDAMLLAGDALMIGSITYLPSMYDILPKEKVMRISNCIKTGLFELGSAEFEEMKFIRNFKITPEQYLQVINMKAADVESYTKIGAIIGGANEEKINDYAQFGRLLGIITILRDDIEDTFNDKQELLSRIMKESLPLPIIFSLHDPACQKALTSISERSSPKDLDSLLKIINKNQGFEKTKIVIETNLAKIHKLLAKVENKKLVALFKRLPP